MRFGKVSAEQSGETLPKRAAGRNFRRVEHSSCIVIEPDASGGRPTTAGVRERQATVRQGCAESAVELADEEHADWQGFGNEGDADLVW